MEGIKALILALLVCVLGGCGVSRQTLSIAAVHEPIPVGQARVVFARKSNLFLGQGAKAKVICDGKLVGEIAAGGYLAWDQSPGKALIEAEGEPLHILLKANEVTCILFVIGMWPFERNFNLTVIDVGNYENIISTYSVPEKPEK